jgi:flagellar biogenesis protein FliO
MAAIGLLAFALLASAARAEEPQSSALPSLRSQARSRGVESDPPSASGIEPLRVPPPSREPSRDSAAAYQEVAPRSSGWWLSSAAITLVLAVCGTICIAARRYRGGVTPASLRIVGRVSLSSRHSIFLVRAGDRVLLIGTGSQGAPTLLGELGGENESAEAGPSSARNALKGEDE